MTELAAFTASEQAYFKRDDQARPREAIVYEPLPEDDPKQRRPDTTRAREPLDWEPRVPAKEGLKLTFEWFAQRLSPSEVAPLAEQ
jgi:UDP-glucuronate decarboxylase